MEELCNGKKDCPLGDDESEMCSECSTKNCEYQCKNTPTGAKCECAKGYRLDSDGFSCVDLDECTLPERACHHFCENQIGSFRCSCAKGYHLKDDGKSCKLSDASEGTLLIGLLMEIQQRSLEDFGDFESTSVYKGSILSFDYFRRENKLFMITHDYESKGLRLIVKEDGKSIRILRENVLPSMILAVDWIGGNLFSLDQVRDDKNPETPPIGRISVCTMDGKFCRGIIEGKEVYAYDAFAIHPMRGLVFFIENNQRSARIMMANMDGSQKQVLLETNTLIRTLTIDCSNHDVYFSDMYSSSIQRVNIDTKKITVMVQNTWPSDGLTFHNGFLFWTETPSSLRVLDVARNDGSRIHVIIPNEFFPVPIRHLAINDSLHQLEPSAGNPCSELDCHWICVIVPGFTAKCLCPDGSSVLGTASCELF